MDKNGLYNKIIIFGIIILLTGTCIIPATGSIIQKQALLDESHLGKIIYVDDDNTEGPWNGTQEHPYRWIWQGIDAAEDGDTVYVFLGIYTDRYGERQVYINKSINLIGEDKKRTQIYFWDPYWDWIIKIVEDNVTFSNFTIRLKADNDIMDKKMYINASYCTVSDNVFWDGVPIGCKDSIRMVDAHYNTITRNSIGPGFPDIQTDSKGISLIRSHHNVISENTIEGYYYGVLLSNSDENIIADNEISTNCGITLDLSSSNKISGNIIDNLCGLVLTESSGNEITHNHFENRMLRNKKARFTDCTNEWDQNYWGRGRIFPRIIFGEKTVNGKSVPAFQVDWHPLHN